MSETDDDIVEVYSAADVTEAYFLRDLLADQGIQSQVVGDALPNLPPGQESAPRLWVHRRDESRAKNVLEEYERRQRAPHPFSDARDAWKCPNCGELVEADFDLCWNCQTPRKEY
ncbi:MAG: putative signal transducing protein [Planctomycetaceae bacterium]